MNRYTKGLLFVFAIISSVILSAQPAKPLSKLWVYQVISQRGGTENIEYNQFATVNGHAGTSILFRTREIGYGNNPIAKYQNFTLIQTAIKTVTEYGIVVGFDRDWQYTGQYLNGGQFTYQNTSTNPDYNTLYTSLNLQNYYDKPVFSNENSKFFAFDYDPAVTTGRGSGTSNPLQYQFVASDPGGNSITYTIERLNGYPVSPNMMISSTGLFYWDKKESSIFTRSTSCPYPYFTQVNVVAHNIHGGTAKWMVTLQVLVGPPPPCQAPPGGLE